MNSESDDQLAQRLEGLDALLTSLKGDDESALHQLEGKEGAEATRRRVEILINAKKYAEAVDVIRDIPIHPRWCDTGTFAFAMNGELETARGVLNWARRNTDQITLQRCLLAYAKARYLSALERVGLDKPTVAGDLRDEEKEDLRDVVKTLEPMIHIVVGQERVNNEIEVESVQLALHAASLTGNHSASVRLSEFLRTRKPVPLSLSRFAEEQIISVPEDLPDRLRDEHPTSFHAQAAALALDLKKGMLPQDAWKRATALILLARNEADRESFARIINDIAQRIGSAALAEADVLLSGLLPEENRFRQLLSVDRLLRQGNTDEAASRLERLKSETDAYWLQLYANYRLQLGDTRSAGDYFARASEVFPHPQLLRIAAAICVEIGRLSTAANILERLLTREPTDVLQLKQLASVYVEQNLFAKAAAVFSRMSELEPNETGHLYNFAISRWRAGDLNESVAAFDRLCQSLHNVPVEIVLSKGNLLLDLDRAGLALEWLLAHKEKYWGDYRYVQLLISIGFAAQREDVGHDAMRHLEELQLESKAPADVLQKKTLDDLKEYLKASKETFDSASQLLLDNRLLWMFVDRTQRRPAFFGWKVRSQALNWVPDDPIARSAVTIYSTNSFSVFGLGTAEAVLREIVAPVPNKPVVIDLSALITLSELGLLKEAIEYFGGVKIPAVYISTSVSELQQLRPHQPSRLNALRQIQDAFRNKSLKVSQDTGSSGKRPFPYVHEYTLDEEDSVEHFYRLVDVVAVADGAGFLSEATLVKLREVSHRASGADDAHPKLTLGDDILVDLSTLMTVCQVGGLEGIAKTFNCHIDTSAQREIENGLASFAAQQELLDKHQRLWDFIRKDDRIEQVAPEFPPELMDRDEGSRISVASGTLAEQLHLPLYADDRVLQTIALNTNAKEQGRGFGTDALLQCLFAEGRISHDTYSASFMQLIAWRYRFLVPSSAMLVELAYKFLDHPPGDDLIAMARYFHDCMADPGLLCGVEPTNPPMALGVRLFMSLTAVVIEFLMDVWTDDRFSAEIANRITTWTLTEMLPSPPHKLGDRGALLASLSTRLVISRALLRGCTKNDIERAAQGMTAIKASLQISESEYWRHVTEVIDAEY